MKRFAVGAAVVFTFLLVASVAGAVPPGFCDDHPDHAKCTTTTTSATTTTTTPTQLPACSDVMTITGKASTSFECLWTPVNNGSEAATVTVSNIQGAISGPPTVFVRDDSPGDICLLEQAGDWGGQTGPEYVASFDLFYHQVPSGDGVLDYSAWLGHSYWGFVMEPGMEEGTHWCAPQDPILDSIREDTNGQPLHLVVSFNAKKGGSLEISLSPGQATP